MFKIDYINATKATNAANSAGAIHASDATVFVFLNDKKAYVEVVGDYGVLRKEKLFQLRGFEITYFENGKPLKIGSVDLEDITVAKYGAPIMQPIWELISPQI